MLLYAYCRRCIMVMDNTLARLFKPSCQDNNAIYTSSDTSLSNEGALNNIMSNRSAYNNLDACFVKTKENLGIFVSEKSEMSSHCAMPTKQSDSDLSRLVNGNMDKFRQGSAEFSQGSLDFSVNAGEGNAYTLLSCVNESATIVGSLPRNNLPLKPRRGPKPPVPQKTFTNVTTLSADKADTKVDAKSKTNNCVTTDSASAENETNRTKDNSVDNLVNWTTDKNY